MNINKLPWDLIQSFIAVSQLGSLSKAAREIGTSQPTLSRHIATLENKLGMTLFDRSTQGLLLTEAGSRLIESSESMKLAAEQFIRIASGVNMSLTGSIRISANEVIGLYYLPEIIANFNRDYPEVYVEIDISNQETSLNKRDADIALRMFRPTQVELVAKRLPSIELNFVASKDYLAKHAAPIEFEDIFQHKLIGYDRDSQFKDKIKQLGWPLTEKSFINRTDFLPLQIELARSGAGISATHTCLLKRFTDLEVVLPNIPLPPLDLWLVCHADVQHNSKIRVMMDFLTDAFEKRLDNVDH